MSCTAWVRWELWNCTSTGGFQSVSFSCLKHTCPSCQVLARRPSSRCDVYLSSLLEICSVAVSECALILLVCQQEWCNIWHIAWKICCLVDPWAGPSIAWISSGKIGWKQNRNYGNIVRLYLQWWLLRRFVNMSDVEAAVDTTDTKLGIERVQACTR